MARPHSYVVQAVVLRRVNFGEEGRLVTLFTPDRGKKIAIAKGAKRPFSKLASHLEPFTRCQLFIAQGRNLDLITQASTIENYASVRSNIVATSAACYAIELVDKATEHELDQRTMYDLLVALLARLDRGGEPEALLRFFDMRMLTILGYRPSLKTCAACNADVIVGKFSTSQGGMHCDSCAAAVQDAYGLSVPVLNVLRLWQSGAYATWEEHPPSTAVAAEAASLLRACLLNVIEREPKSTRLLERLRSEDAYTAAQ